MTVCTLKSFLGNPNQGGGPEDLLVVQDMQSFVDRHAELLCFADAETKSVKLCNNISPDFSSLVKPVCAAFNQNFEGFLNQLIRKGFPFFSISISTCHYRFVSRSCSSSMLFCHQGMFLGKRHGCPTFKRLAMQGVANKETIGAAEARVIQRLTEILRDGPGQATSALLDNSNLSNLPINQIFLLTMKYFFRCR